MRLKVIVPILIVSLILTSLPANVVKVYADEEVLFSDEMDTVDTDKDELVSVLSINTDDENTSIIENELEDESVTDIEVEDTVIKDTLSVSGENNSESIDTNEVGFVKDTEDDIVASGEYGNVTWQIDTYGKLIVQGTGNFQDDSVRFKNPWYSYRNKIYSAEIDLKNIPSISFMFYGCEKLGTVDLSKLETSETTSMEYVFSQCNYLMDVDVSGFDTSKATKMNGMFSSCIELETLDVSNFDTSNVVEASSLFSGCKKLKSIDVSNFNTSNMTDMSNMFYNCRSLTELSVSNFDTTNVTNMGYMFGGCSGLTSLNISNFDTAKVTNLSGFFSDCSGLTSVNISGFDTSNVTSMSNLFNGCGGLSSIDVSNLSTSKVYSFGGMFANCTGLTTLDLSSFDTSNAEIFGWGLWTEGMFEGCTSLTSLDLSNFDTRKVDRMGRVFDGCSALRSLNISSFDTSKVTDMYCMFRGCKSLESLDVSSFDTSKVIDMSSMFADCRLIETLDVQKFDTSKVQLMEYMFYGCESLQNLNLSSFNTSQVQPSEHDGTVFHDRVLSMDGSMYMMFCGCKRLETLDLSSFDTSKVKHMGYMFSGCKSLKTINLSSFNTSECNAMYGMFNECSSLETLDLSNFDMIKINNNFTNFFVDCTKLVDIKAPMNMPPKYPIDLPGTGWINNSTSETATKITSEITGGTLFIRNGGASTDTKEFWVLDPSTGYPMSYYRNGEMLRNRKECLSFKEGDVIFRGNWYFGANGIVQTGDQVESGHYYNTDPSTGYPYGIELDYYNLLSALSMERASTVLGNYTYPANFVNDISDGTAFRDMFTNFMGEITAIWKTVTKQWRGEIDVHSFEEWCDEVAYYYMNDEKACTGIISKILEKKYDNETGWPKNEYKVGKNTTKAYMDMYKKSVKDIMKSDKDKGNKRNSADYGALLKDASDEDIAKMASQTVDSVFDVVDLVPEYMEAFTDYSQNIAFLESIENNVGDKGVLKSTVSRVKMEYQEKGNRALFDSLITVCNNINAWRGLLDDEKILIKLPSYNDTDEKIKADITVQLLDAAGFKFKKVCKVLDVINEHDPRLHTTDFVVNSTYLRSESIKALKNAESDLLDGHITYGEVTTYYNLFYLAQELTKLQYENMKEFYESSSDSTEKAKAEFLTNEITKISSMEAFNYSGKNAGEFAEWEETPDGKRYVYTNGTCPNNVWKFVDGHWYYFERDYVVTGWKEIDGDTYYFSEGDDSLPKGAAYIGFNTIGGSEYYFDQKNNKHGAMAKNRRIQFKYFGSDGKRDRSKEFLSIPKKKPYAAECDGFECSINCPVDVVVLKSNNVQVASIINDVASDKYNNDNVFVCVDENLQKIVFLPKGTDYSLSITATGAGTLDYTVSEYDNSEDTFGHTVFYQNIPISRNDKFISSDVENTNYRGETYFNHFLYHDGDIVEVNRCSDALDYYDVKVNTSDEQQGTVSGNQICPEGSFVKISAKPKDGFVFKYWEDENGNQLDKDLTFRTVVEKNMEFTAVFGEYVALTDIEFDITSNTIEAGKSFTITPRFSPTDATDTTLTWTTSNSAVASVTDGIVTAKAEGQATITATAPNRKSAECVVTVTPKNTQVTGVTVSPRTITMIVGEKTGITATVSPADADNKKITWSSSDSSIVSVDDNGTITGKKEGKADIIVTTYDGSYTAKCVVTVKAKTSPSPSPKYTYGLVNNTSFKDEEIGFEVTNQTSDLVLHISNSRGTLLKTLISGDSSQKNTTSAFYEIYLTDSHNNMITTGFGTCYIYIPLNSDMNISNGSIWAITTKNGGLDKSVTCSPVTYKGRRCVKIGTPHFTEFGILYKKNSSDSGNGSGSNNSSGSSSGSSSSSSSSSNSSSLDILSSTTSVTNSPAMSTGNQSAKTGSSRTLDSVPKTGDREWE